MIEEFIEFEDISDDIFQTANNFSMMIEKSALQENNSLLETIIEYCNLNKLEPETIVKFLNRSIREKLELEAYHKKMLKTKNTTIPLPQ